MTSGHQTATCPRAASTVSFRPQQTQNTALVVEHRCLYTHDLRRKAKRWQDGFLRFHTFNKRIMIYDVQRNYIGDTHWREADPVQDGDELELDRPVLVQVGEQVGSVEQDLTGLLEKRHNKDYTTITGEDLPDSSPPIPMIGVGPKTKPAASMMLIPKSLNTLLGTPKGATGKACLPVKSPYEVRRAVEYASRQTIPPAKKRCIESPTRRARPPIDKQRLPQHTLKRQVVNKITDNLNVTNPPSECEVSYGDEQPIAFGTQDGNFALADLNTTGTTTSRRNINLQLSGLGLPSRGQRNSGRDLEVDTLQVIHMGRKTLPRTRESRELESQSPPLDLHKTPGTLTGMESTKPPGTIGILSNIENCAHSINEGSKPRSKLRLASNKPRRKLMYKELLPQNVPILGRGSGSAYLDDEGKTVKSPSEHGNVLPEEQDLREAKRRRLATEGNLINDKPLPIKDFSSKPDRRSNGNGKPPNPSKRDTRRQQAKSINEGENSMPSKANQPIISETNSTVHDTDLALAKMDEILLGGSAPQTSATLKEQHSVNDSSPIQEPHLPSNGWTHDSSTLQNPNLPESLRTVQESRVLACESTIQSSISPSCASQVDAVDTPGGGNEIPEHLVIPASIKRPPLDSITNIDCPWAQVSPVVASEEPNSSDNVALHEMSAATKHGTSATAVTTMAPPETCPAHVEVPKPVGLPAPPSSAVGERRLDGSRLPNLLGESSSSGIQPTKATTSLPPFKPLCSTRAKRQSPMKKSMSDTSAITGARAVTTVGSSAKIAGETNCAKEQLASPWSREAWDLFGCGRDGKIVDFKTFCLSEGV